MFSTSYALGVNCVKNLSLTRVVWCGVVWWGVLLLQFLRYVSR